MLYIFCLYLKRIYLYGKTLMWHKTAFVFDKAKNIYVQ